MKENKEMLGSKLKDVAGVISVVLGIGFTAFLTIWLAAEHHQGQLLDRWTIMGVSIGLLNGIFQFGSTLVLLLWGISEKWGQFQSCQLLTLILHLVSILFFIESMNQTGTGTAGLSERVHQITPIVTMTLLTRRLMGVEWLLAASGMMVGVIGVILSISFWSQMYRECCPLSLPLYKEKEEETTGKDFEPIWVPKGNAHHGALHI